MVLEREKLCVGSYVANFPYSQFLVLAMLFCAHGRGIGLLIIGSIQDSTTAGILLYLDYLPG